jgi:hypothetical protein
MRDLVGGSLQCRERTKKSLCYIGAIQAKRSTPAMRIGVLTPSAPSNIPMTKPTSMPGPNFRKLRFGISQNPKGLHPRRKRKMITGELIGLIYPTSRESFTSRGYSA